MLASDIFDHSLLVLSTLDELGPPTLAFNESPWVKPLVVGLAFYGLMERSFRASSMWLSRLCAALAVILSLIVLFATALNPARARWFLPANAAIAFAAALAMDEAVRFWGQQFGWRSSKTVAAIGLCLVMGTAGAIHGRWQVLTILVSPEVSIQQGIQGVVQRSLVKGGSPSEVVVIGADWVKLSPDRSRPRRLGWIPHELTLVSTQRPYGGKSLVLLALKEGGIDTTGMLVDWVPYEKAALYDLEPSLGQRAVVDTRWITRRAWKQRAPMARRINANAFKFLDFSGNGHTKMKKPRKR
jgi:hypothetical protein